MTRIPVARYTNRLAEMGAQALLACLPDMAAGRLQAEIQDDQLANYASKLDKQEGLIDWSQSAVEIDRKVRAFNPWPVAQCRFGEKVMRIWQAEPLKQGVPLSRERYCAAVNRASTLPRVMACYASLSCRCRVNAPCPQPIS